MIKASELRIGNLVIIEGDENNTVISGVFFENEKSKYYYNKYCISFHNNNQSISLEFINPIPLTEEWLVKFGIEKIKYPENSFSVKDGIIVKYSDEWTYEIDTSREGDCYNIVATFKYVHQLQNLFFALTGTELIIK